MLNQYTLHVTVHVSTEYFLLNIILDQPPGIVIHLIWYMYVTFMLVVNKQTQYTCIRT